MQPLGPWALTQLLLPISDYLQSLGSPLSLLQLQLVAFATGGVAKQQHRELRMRPGGGGGLGLCWGRSCLHGLAGGKEHQHSAPGGALGALKLDSPELMHCSG